MERVLDAVVCTEKAPLVGTDLTQVIGCQRQTSCGRRDREELPQQKIHTLKKHTTSHTERRCQTAQTLLCITCVVKFDEKNKITNQYIIKSCLLYFIFINNVEEQEQ